MIGIIQQANKSKSGKTLSIQIENVWYTSKNWELEQSVGRTVIFDPSAQSFPDGSSIQWLNDYVFEDQATTPSGQAMERALARSEPPAESYQDQAAQAGGAPQTAARGPQAASQVNKDSLIGALALTKSITAPKEQVWEAFVYFYHKMENFDPSIPF